METNMQVGTSIAIVVQDGGEGSWLVWNALGVLCVANSPAELGRWVLDALGDAKVPRVDRAARPGGGRVVQGISQILDQVDAQAGTDTGDLSAVHLVVYLAAAAETPDAVVFPAKGPPRSARGAVKLGEVLAKLAVDEAQPRVAPGPPPDPAGDLMGRGFEIAGKLLGDYFREGGEEQAR